MTFALNFDSVIWKTFTCIELNSNAFFCYRYKPEKKPLNTSNVIKISPNRRHIFQNKLQNTWAMILNINIWYYVIGCLICKAMDKNKIKIQQTVI